MLSTPKAKGGLFLASSLCDGLEDNNIRQVATLLLNKDADPNVLIPAHGVTPFHLVIGNDSEEFAEEVTKLFLRHGGDPNVRSNDGMTPVHVAAAWGRTNILQLLLANGGDPLCLDNDGRSPFHYAFDGRYFKAVTMLGKHCENIQNEDEKPKYNMVLDKVLVTNGDIIAEYVTSQDIMSELDVNTMTSNSIVTDLFGYKPNFLSLTSETDNTPDRSNINGIKYNEFSKDEYPSVDNNAIAGQQNKSSETDNKDMLNCSFVNLDLDFDFANLHLSDIIQKEKSLVNRIINQLSTTLSDSTINETLHNIKNIKREKSSIVENSFDMLLQFKQNVNQISENEYHKSPKDFPHESNHTYDEYISKPSTPLIKRECLKYSARSTCKKKHKISRKIPSTPTCDLNNSIVSMSPNMKTPIHRKGTPSTVSYIHNDNIISKSPNFVTPTCTSKKRSRVKVSHVNEYLSPKISKKFYEHKIPVQNFELDRCKKYIAQSTPRRKKKSIYKFYSRKKKLDSCRQNDDVSTDNVSNIVDTDENVPLETTLDTSNEFLSLNLKKNSTKEDQSYYSNNHLAIKLDEGKYDEDGIIHDNDSNLYNVELNKNNTYNQIDNENRSVNSLPIIKKYVNSETAQIKTEYPIVRKDIFTADNVLKTIDPYTNIRSTDTSKSSSLHTESFMDCIDCDIKKLLNEDLNMNISKTCKLHTKNWCNRFHEVSSGKSTADNILPIVNLSIKCKNQIYLSDSEKLCFLRSSSKIDDNSTNTKRTENMLETEDLDIYKIEKTSSLLSYVSTQEEYKYEDPERGIILLERRLCITPFSSTNRSECSAKTKMTISNTTSASQSLPKELLFIDNATLRRELTQFGDHPGPITTTTKQIYLKRLVHLRNIKNNSESILQNIPKSNTGKNQIKPHLEFGNWVNHLDTYRSVEKQIFQEFVSPDPSRRWREGTSKTSFTYLLLDPRITQDLPHRNIHCTESEVWTTFLNAIFYIGKGKRSRPFAHLYDAFNTWVSKSPIATSKKIDRILDIWNNDHGVVCLHVFQNIIPVEAYTREAAMIDAIGTESLGNCKSGEYYGIAATWCIKQKQKFGRYLLYKAMQIMLYEGERQLFPQCL